MHQVAGPGPNPGLEDEEDLGQPGSQQDNQDRSDDFLDEEDDEMAGFIVDEDGGGGGNRRRRSAGLHAPPGTNAEALDVTPQALALAPTLSALSATCGMQLLRCYQLYGDNISRIGRVWRSESRLQYRDSGLVLLLRPLNQ